MSLENAGFVKIPAVSASLIVNVAKEKVETVPVHGLEVLRI